jgi:Reverse transcriptase (RNA-dependent DNA polymerase)
MRPLGIPALEDKIVQQAVRMLLEPFYEEEFRAFSYGFRPGRSPLQAVKALHLAITTKKVQWILKAPKDVSRAKGQSPSNEIAFPDDVGAGLPHPASKIQTGACPW